MTSWNENSVRPWRLIATHTYSPSSDRRKSYSVRRDPCKSFLRRLTDTPCFTRQSISTSSLQTATRKLLSRDSSLSLNSMGPTTAPTRTLGMRLSCNFVNVYTIVYHVQYTYTCTPAHPQRTSSRGKARIGQKSVDFVGELNGPRAPRQAECRARILARKSARKSVSVSVSVSVPWNLSLITLSVQRDMVDFA